MALREARTDSKDDFDDYQEKETHRLAGYRYMANCWPYSHPSHMACLPRMKAQCVTLNDSE